MELLNEQCEGKFDAQDRELMKALRQSITYMQNLISDLDEHAVTEGTKTACDVDVLVHNVLEMLAPGIKAEQAVITREPMPIVIADETRLARVFQNLLENGLKYRSQLSPRIHIGVNAESTEWVFFVRDNGIGVDRQYWAAIFDSDCRVPLAMFRPGEGLGLAICDKIIKQHGGRMWVKSEVDRGSTFFFSLPRRTQPALTAGA